MQNTSHPETRRVDPETGEVLHDTDHALSIPVQSTVAEFEAAHAELADRILGILRPNKDFGKIPGTKGKVLLDSGAKRIAEFLRLTIKFSTIDHFEDFTAIQELEIHSWITKPKPNEEEVRRLKAQKLGRNFQTDSGWIWQEKQAETIETVGIFRYTVLAEVYTRAGVLISQGIALASSTETKYCRTPRDQMHTLLAMAQKRARVLAIRNALALEDVWEDQGDLE